MQTQKQTSCTQNAAQVTLSFLASIVMAAIVSFSCQARASVPGLLGLVPGTEDYELIYKLNPLDYDSSGYQVDNGDSYSGTLKRVGYLLKLTGKQGQMTWVFVSMDPFSQDLNKVGVPNVGSGVVQMYVNNLEIAGNSPAVENGTFEKGNIEFWPNNYGGTNVQNIPGAGGDFDFGDGVSDPVDGYGSMQVHNYLEKQTVLAFNKLKSDKNCDLGIGNNTTKEGRPDWTFSSSGKTYANAELLVVGTFDDLKIKKVIKADPQKISMTVATEKPFFACGEDMAFSFKVDFGGQPIPEKPYTIKWTRTGDDGERTTGSETVISGKPVVLTTSLDEPGFVRIKAYLVDPKGRQLRKKGKKGKMTSISFDGGAGAEPEKLQAAAEEPADFDAFWAKQKVRLATVPVKHHMEKVSKPEAKVEVYAVAVDCAPRGDLETQQPPFPLLFRLDNSHALPAGSTNYDARARFRAAEQPCDCRHPTPAGPAYRQTQISPISTTEQEALFRKPAG